MKKPTLQEIQAKVIGQRFELALPLERAEADSDNRTVRIAVTSDQPIEHWFGELQLNHSPSAIRMQRVKGGAPLLLEHRRDQKIGGMTDWQTDGHFLRATAKFSRRPEAEAEWQDYQDGIPRAVSGGFLLHHLVLVEEREDDPNLYRSDDWEPIEASLVSIPADTSVGIGRSLPARTEAKREDVKTEPEEEHTECTGEPDRECEQCQESNRAASQPRDNPQPFIQVTRSYMDKDQELLAIGERFGEVELARDFALAGKSIEELRAAILAKRTTTQAPQPKPPVELTEKETRQYSVARAVRSQLAFREGRNGDVKCFEREISDTIDKNLPKDIQRQGGIFVPTMFKREYLERAGLEVKTPGAGGYSVFTEYGGFLDALRNSTKVLQLGATMLPGLQGNVSFVRQATDSVAYWVGENPGADVTASDLTIDLVTLSPKTLMARSSFSRQLLNQSVLAADQLVQNSLVIAHALKLDQSALHNDGTANDIKGIYFQTGVNAVAFGGNPTYDKVVDMETAVESANAAIGEMGYLTTTGVKGKAKKTLEFAVNGADKLWMGGKDGGEMNGYRAEASTNVKSNLGAGTNEHGIVFGVWSALLFGEWGAMELLTDPFTLAGQAMIRVISFNQCDLQLKYGPCFSKGTGLILS